MGHMLTISNSIISNNRTSVEAYVSEPAGEPKGGLIVIHEVWGLVDHTKDVADRFAAEGYLVLVPDLLAETAMTPELATELQATLSDPEQRSKVQPKLRELMAPLHAPGFAERTLASLQACFEHLYAIPALAGRVAVSGFCFGGTYSFSLAVSEPRLRAAVPFYGHADLPVEQLRHIACPVLAFYGEKDAALVDKLPELTERMDEAGIGFASVVYPGTGHAFFNDTNAWTYDADASEDAWQRTLGFLAKSFAA
ncbi:dienelactone hydrolase family protein [Pseudarthrobacter sp. S9]|uniref:dienelactone hydrolase family protein n=1 Tax=Pseudarthrobacter sp. S9 TaxID=3418421 RepID=UPI003D057746